MISNDSRLMDLWRQRQGIHKETSALDKEQAVPFDRRDLVVFETLSVAIAKHMHSIFEIDAKIADTPAESWAGWVVHAEVFSVYVDAGGKRFKTLREKLARNLDMAVTQSQRSALGTVLH
jgi:L-ascorbate metabolism protein UlaG (beta-lactamase superfamily)